MTDRFLSATCRNPRRSGSEDSNVDVPKTRLMKASRRFQLSVNRVLQMATMMAK